MRKPYTTPPPPTMEFLEYIISVSSFLSHLHHSLTLPFLFALAVLIKTLESVNLRFRSICNLRWENKHVVVIWQHLRA